ncbi:MAG: protein kinase, partial [Planctomycetaceae bacterium]|nr:protein kinase [Planctomycetaceae bacterium]
MPAANSQQYCHTFTAALAAGRVSNVEEFLGDDVQKIDDTTFEQLLSIEIEHRVNNGEFISEAALSHRFPQRRSVVSDAFSESRTRMFEQRSQFIPDPKKTSPELILDMFYQSTNVISPDNYLKLSTDLETETLPPEVRLRIVKGPHAGRELCFSESASVLVGRGDDARLALPKDPRCSRLHCRFEIVPPQCTVVDLKSTNGTLVNGRRMERAKLKDSDTVQVGTSKIRIHIQQGREGSSQNLNAVLDTYHPMQDTPQIPGYEVMEQIGNGRFGVVYRGRQIRTGRDVAVKLLSSTAVPDQEEIQQFIHETSVSVKLRHPRIVETLDFGIHEGMPYLVLEYINTINIRTLLEQQSLRTRCLESARLMAMVLEGLACAHEMEIVHRDIKVSNLLFSHENNRISVKISDFGLA